MAGEKSIEDKTRSIYNQRIQQGKEFQQMQGAQNQLLQIQAARQQNLRENRMESGYLAQQNQILSQAAQVGMMSNGAGQMQVNPATRNAMGRYGLNRPMTTTTTKQTQQQTVTKQNVTIHNNTTNITNNNSVPANIGGPVQGRPLQFQPQQAAQQKAGNGGMDKFKTWLNQTFTKQEEERVKRDREYQRRELSLSKSANKMMRKLEDFSRDLTKKLDPRNVGKSMTSQLKTLFRLIGIGALVVNFKKILTSIDKIEKKYIPEIKGFAKWFKGDREGQKEPEFLSKIRESIATVLIGPESTRDVKVKEAFRKKGFLGAILEVIKQKSGDFWNKAKEVISGNWEYAKNIEKPNFSDKKHRLEDTIGYIGDLVAVLLGGEKAYNSIRAKNIEKHEKQKSENDFHANEETVSAGYAGNALQDQGRWAGRAIKGYEGTSGGIMNYGSAFGIEGLYSVDKDRRVGLSYRPNMKTVPITAMEKDRKTLSTTFAPVFNKSGTGYELDENGNYVTRERTTLEGTLSQMNEISHLWTDSKRGKADVKSMLVAMSRMNGAVERDGVVTIGIDSVIGMIGLAKTKELIQRKKLSLRKFYVIKRPKTLRELAAVEELRDEEFMEGIGEAVALQMTGLGKVIRITDTMAGGAVGAGVGALFEGVGAIPGFLVGGSIGWASSLMDTNPTMRAIKESIIRKGATKSGLFTFDVIPDGVQHAMELAKMLYGPQTCFVETPDGKTAQYIYAEMSKEGWKELLKIMFGVDNTAMIGYGIGYEPWENVVQQTFLKNAGEDLDMKNSVLLPKRSDSIAAGITSMNMAAADVQRGKGVLQSWQQQGYGVLDLNNPDTSPVGDYYRFYEEEQRKQQAAENYREAEITGRTEVRGWGDVGKTGQLIPFYKGPTEGLPGSAPTDYRLMAGSFPVPYDPMISGAMETGQGIISPAVLNQEEREKQEIQEIRNAISAGYSEAAGEVPEASGTEPFINAVMPIVKDSLARAGINEDFAPMLVAQAGVETGWRIGRGILQKEGKNLSGIIATGMNQSYPGKNGDVIQGKGVGGRDAIYAKSNTGDGINWYTKFESYQDWVDYLISLVSKKWQAFSGSVRDYPVRILSGGQRYATDPNYASKLLSTYDGVINYLKTGKYVPTKISDIAYAGNIVDYDPSKEGKKTFLDFIHDAKDVVMNAVPGMVKRVQYLADGTKRVYVKGASGGMEWETENSGGLANYEYSTRSRSSAEQAIYNRYSGQSTVAYPGQIINGRMRNEWWSKYFDKEGNLKTKDLENINPELKASLKVIETELKKGNGMDELQLKLAADSLDNTMLDNAGKNAREQRLINALVARNPVTERAGMSTTEAERGINKRG